MKGCTGAFWQSLASCLHQGPLGCTAKAAIPHGIPRQHLVGRVIASQQDRKASTTPRCLALLMFYLTFVNLGWFLRASANAFAPSSPTWLPHILVKREQEISAVLPTDSCQCILPVSLPSFLITSSLSGLWEIWQVPSPLRQVCSTPWHCISNVSRLISTFRPQQRGSSRRQPASAGVLWGSPCCTLVRNSISNGKATLDYTKGYFVREDNMVQAGEIWSTFTRSIWSNPFYADHFKNSPYIMRFQNTSAEV